MNQEIKFISVLKDIDDSFYSEKDVLKKYIDDEIRNTNYKTYKEYIQNEMPEYLSNVDIKLITTITNQNITNKNPFKYFYYFDRNLIEKIFNLLSFTHKAINYYEMYSENIRNYIEENKVTANQNAIKKVIALILDTDKDTARYSDNPENYDFNYIPEGYKVYKYLEDLELTLSNKHYTKLNIYQNLYFELHKILQNKEYYDSKSGEQKKFSNELIVNIVNQLIEVYFEFKNDISFTVHTDLTAYITLKYNYHTLEGITLTHKPTKKSKV